MSLFSKKKSNTAVGLLLKPDRVIEQIKLEVDPPVAVSYTHLTLPTILLV